MVSAKKSFCPLIETIRGLKTADAIVAGY